MGAPVFVAGCACFFCAGGLFFFVLLHGAGAGLSPRRATHFLLLRQKKVSKEKATPSLRPLRFAKGQTCVGAVAGCAAELTARLLRFVQTAAASQMTKHGRTCAHATPQLPRRRRSHRGWTAEQPNIHTGHRVARPSLAGASATRCAGWAERSNGPNGCSLPRPSVCAEERSGQRIRARDCLSAASLSETPLDGSTAGCPSAQRWGRRQWGRLLLPSFLGDARKEGAPPGAHPGTRPQIRHAARSASKPRLRQAQPQRAVALHAGAINLIASCAYFISARAQKHSKTQRPTP
ncbi:hypothetical protein C8C98_3268 [Acidovorax sp. 106]|nr:hypothetical protein C8C98_3268 [Acidovorax sp. 106]